MCMYLCVCVRLRIEGKPLIRARVLPAAPANHDHDREIMMIPIFIILNAHIKYAPGQQSRHTTRTRFGRFVSFQFAVQHSVVAVVLVSEMSGKSDSSGHEKHKYPMVKVKASAEE